MIYVLYIIIFLTVKYNWKISKILLIFFLRKFICILNITLLHNFILYHMEMQISQKSFIVDWRLSAGLKNCRSDKIIVRFILVIKYVKCGKKNRVFLKTIVFIMFIESHITAWSRCTDHTSFSWPGFLKKLCFYLSISITNIEKCIPTIQ